ncbi:MAG: hypothetical protein ACC608_01655 [Anaerofustis sp.]
MKTAIKYQLWSMKRSLITFYIVIYAIYIIVGILAALTFSSEDSVNFSGMQFASWVFVFVLGLNSFRENFYLYLQNSRTRKQLFLSFAFSLLCVSAFMSVIDNINALIATAINPLFTPNYFVSFGQTMAIGTFPLSLLSFFALYAAAGMFGFFVTIGYYHMNKLAKVLVSVGVPLLLFVIFPIADSMLTNGAIYEALGKLFLYMIGYTSGIIGSLISAAIIVLLFGALSWLMIRRAKAKE